MKAKEKMKPSTRRLEGERGRGTRPSTLPLSSGPNASEWGASSSSSSFPLSHHPISLFALSPPRPKGAQEGKGKEGKTPFSFFLLLLLLLRIRWQKGGEVVDGAISFPDDDTDGTEEN